MKFKFEDLLDKIVEKQTDDEMKKPESKEKITVIMQGLPLEKMKKKVEGKEDDKSSLDFIKSLMENIETKGKK